MTCIVVDRLNKSKFIMAGDRAITSGIGHREKAASPKIKKIGNALVGASGTSVVDQLFLEMPELEQLDHVPNLFNFIYEKILVSMKKKLQLHDMFEAHTDEEGEEGDKCLAELLICAQNKCYMVVINTKGVHVDECSLPTGIGCGYANAFGAITMINELIDLNTSIDGIVSSLYFTPLVKVRLATEMAGKCNQYCDENVDILIGGNQVKEPRGNK